MVIPYTVIDPELAPYDQEFQTILNKYCAPNKYIRPWQKTIYFDDLHNNNLIAHCLTNGYTTFKIVYNKYNWDRNTIDEKYSFMMHELTHCYFNENHSPDPAHYMYAYNNNLSINTIKFQVEELIKHRCK